ncbi:MAG: hypothetical protein RJB61_467, partial [Actinomycetota bacterium]
GLEYYPKLLCAVPFTPVPGNRLLALDESARNALAQALIGLARETSVSSLHVLFPGEAEARSLQSAGAMLRQGVQFHWRNSAWPDFESFLGSLTQPKRKKIRAERRKVEIRRQFCAVTSCARRRHHRGAQGDRSHADRRSRCDGHRAWYSCSGRTARSTPCISVMPCTAASAPSTVVTELTRRPFADLRICSPSVRPPRP